MNPLGVSPDRVRLSWEVRGEGSGRLQRAYQILLMRDGAVAWDSARVDSSSSTGIGYAGPALAAGGGGTCGGADLGRERVGVRLERPGLFEVELDRTDGWHASWIGLGRTPENVSPPTGAPDPVTKAMAPSPYLRRVFVLDSPARSVASARLYATALGLYEARLNGARVGDAVLAPGWTDSPSESRTRHTT